MNIFIVYLYDLAKFVKLLLFMQLAFYNFILHIMSEADTEYKKGLKCLKTGIFK